MLQSSIKSAIPLTAQTNPDSFPPYEYRPYPRMMLMKGGKPFRAPSGEAIVVYDREEEEQFLADHPDAQNPAEMKRTASDLRSENADLRSESADLKRQLEELRNGGGVLGKTTDADDADAEREAATEAAPPAEEAKPKVQQGSKSLLNKVPGKLKG